jgi:hypothetical protein
VSPTVTASTMIADLDCEGKVGCHKEGCGKVEVEIPRLGVRGIPSLRKGRERMDARLLSVAAARLFVGFVSVVVQRAESQSRNTILVAGRSLHTKSSPVDRLELVDVGHATDPLEKFESINICLPLNRIVLSLLTGEERIAKGRWLFHFSADRDGSGGKFYGAIAIGIRFALRNFRAGFSEEASGLDDFKSGSVPKIPNVVMSIDCNLAESSRDSIQYNRPVQPDPGTFSINSGVSLDTSLDLSLYRGLLVGAVYASRIERVEDQESKPDKFRYQLGIVPAIALFVADYGITGVGWWNLTSGTTSLCGYAALFLASPSRCGAGGIG